MVLTYVLCLKSVEEEMFYFLSFLSCFLAPRVETKVGECAYQTGSCVSQYDESLHNQHCTGTLELQCHSLNK